MAETCRIAFRADASDIIGSGHVARCLTLAEELTARGADVLFVSVTIGEELREGASRKGIPIASIRAATEAEDAVASISAMRDFAPYLVVVDHYGLGIEWERKIGAELSSKIMVIDDLADRAHDCSILLDQNLSLETDRYAGLVPDDCTMLLGPAHALLRQEFRREVAPRSAALRRLLVSFGGSDPAGMVPRALNVVASKPVPGMMTDLVLGPTVDPASTDAGVDASVHVIRSTDNMAELMSSADLMLGAGGSTSWERCAMGLPAVVITVAENQIGATKALAEKGAIEYLGTSDEVSDAEIAEAISRLGNDPQRLAEMREACRAVVPDAYGASRVADVIEEVCS